MPRHGAREWYAHAGHLCEQILTQEFCNGAGARVSVVHMFSVSWEEIHCSALPAKFTFQNSFWPSEMKKNAHSNLSVKCEHNTISYHFPGFCAPAPSVDRPLGQRSHCVHSVPEHGARWALMRTHPIFTLFFKQFLLVLRQSIALYSQLLWRFKMASDKETCSKCLLSYI